MQVILLEKIGKLGALGDEVSVKNGYGRNFLVPQGKAVPATQENRDLFEQRRAELEQASIDRLASAEARKAQLEALESITLASKAGEEGKLFGSIGARDLAEAATTAGVELSKSEIRLPEGPLRTVGEYEVLVHLHPEVDGLLRVTVIAA